MQRETSFLFYIIFSISLPNCMAVLDWDYGGFMANECVFGELGISPFPVHDPVEVLTLFSGP